MKISYISDLHCEFGVRNLTLPGGDVLLLAGDIVAIPHLLNVGQHYEKHAKAGNNHCFYELMEKEFSKYKQVYAIAGNHEYYRADITNALDQLRAATAQFPFFRLLDNEVVDLIPGWKLLASTFWTDYSDFDKKAMDTAHMGMNDHFLIRNGGKAFTPLAAYNRNVEARNFLKASVREHKDTNWVVMTHHTPSMKSSHERWGGTGNLLNFAFSNTRLDRWITTHPQIKFWVHGHTHDSMDYMLGSTRVLCNPKGYGDENKVNFNPNLIFEII